MIKKYDIVLVALDPTQGSEQKGQRPCLVVQNNLANKYARTVVVCPLSSILKDYPHTLIVEPSEENRLAATSRVDILQIRTIDKIRIIKHIGILDVKYRHVFLNKFLLSFDVRDELEI